MCAAPADNKPVLRARYSWKPLGALLVEKGLLTEPELEAALTEQKRSGRLVGQILVESGALSVFSLARALTEQHGVELQTEEDLKTSSASPRAAWRPLGKLLVEKGYLTKAELRKALRAQRESGGRRLLGEILVGEGFLSGIGLARALAEQNGFELEPGDESVQTVLSTAGPGEVTYQVCEVGYDPRYQTRDALYESASLLEAIDFATEFVEDADPDGVEIQRVKGPARETVWTYSESRAAASAASRKGLAETFGFDPTLWGHAASA